MNRTLKFVLIIIGSALALMLSVVVAGFIMLRSAGWVLTNVLDGQPASVSEVGRSIADYAVPEPYSDAYAAEIAEFSMVAYRDVNTDGHIYLIQMPATIQIDPAVLETQLRVASGTEVLAKVAVVQHIPCRIRGQETTLVISEGLNHNNRPYRSASAIFPGKGGQALINISGPVEAWDQAMIDSFVESFQ
ncbi:MAG: hypothetical protein KA586_08325 [Candidatus Promineofilum sp.]|nr:hypothetical protein [Promineifilum sp.]